MAEGSVEGDGLLVRAAARAPRGGRARERQPQQRQRHEAGVPGIQSRGLEERQPKGIARVPRGRVVVVPADAPIATRGAVGGPAKDDAERREEDEHETDGQLAVLHEPPQPAKQPAEPRAARSSGPLRPVGDLRSRRRCATRAGAVRYELGG